MHVCVVVGIQGNSAHTDTVGEEQVRLWGVITRPAVSLEQDASRTGAGRAVGTRQAQVGATPIPPTALIKTWRGQTEGLIQSDKVALKIKQKLQKHDPTFPIMQHLHLSQFYILKTHPGASPCPQPGYPSDLAGWPAQWLCWPQCSCRLAGCCGSASQSSRYGNPTRLNHMGAGLEWQGCADFARSSQTLQYAGENQIDERIYHHESMISEVFHLNGFTLFRQIASSHLLNKL